MATYRNVKGRICAQVCIRPLPRRAKTFGSMQEAVVWAQEMESCLRTLRKGGHKALSRNLFKIPSATHEVVALPRIPASAFCGVYFLFVADRCVYVGKALNVHSRVRAHYVGKRNEKTFDSYSWFSCQPDEMDIYERYFIQLLSPPLNIAAAPPIARQVVQELSTQPAIED